MTAADQFSMLSEEGVVLDGLRGGSSFDIEMDYQRLNKQMRRVWDVMRDMQWRTLREISDITGDPEASVSARLRDFRKKQFGQLTLERRRRDGHGLYEYQLTRESATT